ncbi:MULTISPECIES: TIGR03667 family PPOX class F420-dependent oxidoreductase [Gordonia]|uniref:TIGR03667 family PPOX class F420-dependent oxidoreductase n=1 Tax=Gordonia TaxID=2053 RepID=UPI0007EB8435|nr:TIGR03667 family PPOX class F420-dependent oxidoreductase [Gordonia sp. 852002-50395_SCH5434458]OBC06449.1 PPOX class F420-dependent oxidoreductase [Gordonia sp. 852002-50395_SCH5434458]
MTLPNIPDHVAQRLSDEQVIWLTTVDSKRTPIATPVWFLWHDDAFLIFSKPGQAKLRNIAVSPNVSLHLNSSPSGGDVVVFVSEARTDDTGPTDAEWAAYASKYVDSIPGIGLTPEGFRESYSTTLRASPLRLRNW